ncbi:MAG: hypothetical protein J4G05_04090 [Chlorobi bacterium]|nr:hypothetical protein [Chlorobiota bacterium]
MNRAYNPFFILLKSWGLRRSPSPARICSNNDADSKKCNGRDFNRDIEGDTTGKIGVLEKLEAYKE